MIVNGLIEVVEGERDLAKGSEYRLKLDDGRRLNFLVSSGDRVAGRYVIQPAGLGGLEPEK